MELSKNKEINLLNGLLVKTGFIRDQKNSTGVVRCASCSAELHDGPVGINSLRTYYGGAKDQGTTPEKFKRGSGSITRTALQQLESVGFVEKQKEGRVVTPAGRSFLDKASFDLKKDIPELAKY